MPQNGEAEKGQALLTEMGRLLSARIWTAYGS